MIGRPTSLDESTDVESPVDLEPLMTVLREDQRRRWMAGERFGVSSYLIVRPELRRDSEAVFELLYREWLLREELGERPDFAEYFAVFPEFAERLRMQIEVHEALEIEEGWACATESGSGKFVAIGCDDERTLVDVAVPDVPGYEILGELGRGGMGVVFRARQLRPNREVALKMILAGRYASRRDLNRLQNEAEAIATLDHPNIVPVLDLGEHEGLPYFTMRLIAGGSLARRPSMFLDDPRAAARLVLVIAGAVHHAHQRGILHRDLKPANILLDDEGQPHVTDFGLAKRIQSDVDLTLPGSVLGSPAYMAPEQASGDLSKITTATDVYGLGAILYTMLTGLPPLQNSSADDALDRLRNVDPPAPSRINSRVPRSLETVCRKCLEKDPTRRYTSAADLAADLRRWLGGEPIAARPVSPVTRCWLWVRRRPVQAALAASLLAALVAGSVGVGTQWRRAETHRRDLIRERRLLLASEASEREGRLRSQARFSLALEAVQGYFNGAAESSMLLAPDLNDSRRKLLLQASDYFKKLQSSLEDDPSPEAQAQLAEAYTRFASISAELGSEDVARSTYDQAIVIRRRLVAESPDELEHLRQLSDTVFVRGLAERKWNRMDAALRSFAESRSILEDLIRRTGGDERHVSALSWTLGNIASVQFLQGQREEALRGHERVMAIRDELVQNHPTNRQYRSDRAWVWQDIGIGQTLLRRFDEAGQILSRASDEFEALHREEPGNIATMERLIGTLNQVAATAWEMKRPDVMLGASQRAIEIAGELYRFAPDDYRYSRALALAYWHDYRRRHMAGDRQGARRSLERSIAIDEKLVRTYPTAVRFQDDLARALVMLSQLDHESGNAVAALASIEKARDIRTALLRGWPDDETCLANLADCDLFMTVFLSKLGRHVEARASLERAEKGVRRLNSPSAVLFYNLACALSVMSREDSSASPGDSIDRADRAMAALKRSVTAGYRNANRLLDDGDFDPIRPRDDFQRLYRSLAFPADPFVQ